MFKTKTGLLIIFILLFGFSFLFAQDEPERGGSGRIIGVITDHTTGEPLIGANIMLEGTSLGAATDLDGTYIINLVPEGTYTVLIRYIGYEDDESSIEVTGGQTTQHNVSLVLHAVEGEEIVVTAQAEGQRQAINRQLTARTVKNVVAAERIQEFPDESAATALSRLPGISLMDGDKVVIRGMEAKLNTILVNDIQLPSTDLEDRSTNLGFISSNMLDGIEVVKVLTPDMDANTVGGVVNLKLREAPRTLKFDVLAQGAYNTQDRVSDNYKFWGSLSNRYFNNKLGVFVQGNTERKDAGLDQVNVGWGRDENPDPYGLGTYRMNNTVLIDEENIITNTGGSVILDYLTPNGKFVLQNTFANTINDNARFRQELDFAATELRYALNRDKHRKRLVVNALQAEYNLGRIQTELSLSHSYSDKETDIRYGDPGNAFGFSNQTRVEPVFQDKEGNTISNIDTLRRYFTLDDVINNIQVDPTDWEGARVFGWSVLRGEAFSQRIYTGNLDFTIPVSFSKNISGNFKLGGKFTRSHRINDVEESYRRTGDPDFYYGVRDFIPGKILASPNRQVYFSDLRDYDYDRGEYYLNGDYPFKYVLDKEMMDRFMPRARDGWLKSRHTARSERDDFNGTELFTGAYLMGDFNIGKRISLIAGGRFEHYNMNYKSTFVIVTHSVDGDAKLPDTLNTVDRNDDDFFPNAQIRFKFTDWADIRLAYTKGISRPDYEAIMPNVYYSPGEESQAGNTKLKPQIASNLDAYFSFYNNQIGLLTVGGFYKELDNTFFETRMYYPHIGRYGVTFPDSASLRNAANDTLMPIPTELTPVTAWVNNPNPAIVKGFELEWQSNFWYLPKPLNSLVLNINYTRVWSQMAYRQIELYDSTYLDGRIWRHKYITRERSRNARLLGQGDHTVNFTVGVDYKGFSGRISFRMQDDVLSQVGLRPEEDRHTRAIYRWDLTLKQKLPIEGLVIGFNGINLTHSVEERYQTFRRDHNSPVVDNTTEMRYEPRTLFLYLRYGF
jgi:TonB-dependent receptor